MYVAVVFLEADPRHRDTLRDELLIQARNALEREAGCQRFDVCADPVDPGSFLLYEVFEDEAAYRSHCATQYHADFVGLMEGWTRTMRVLTFELVSGGGGGGITGHEGGHA